MATQEVTICSLAIACHDTLEDFDPESSNHNDKDFIRLIDTLHHRLNAWGDDLGVFVAGSGCLDHLLEDNSTIKEQIEQNLSQLLRNLRLCLLPHSYT
jgi:hypothetical protein